MHYAQYILLSGAIGYTLAQDAPFTVTSPNAGATLILGANELPIEWTVASWTSDMPVSVSLQQGEDVASLENVEDIGSAIENSGSYVWETVDSTSTVRTGCNYTIRMHVDGLVAYSPYFTIINAEDGLVPDGAACPVDQGTDSPQLAQDQAVTILPGNRNDPSSSNNNNINSGISTSTLAIAIVIPIVALLLLLFGFFTWLGLRRGWFVKLTDRRLKRWNSRATHENTAGFGSPGADQRFVAPVASEKRIERRPVPQRYRDVPQELHAEHRPWEAEAEATQVHQLEGDERDARFEGDHVRSG